MQPRKIHRMLLQKVDSPGPRHESQVVIWKNQKTLIDTQWHLSPPKI